MRIPPSVLLATPFLFMLLLTGLNFRLITDESAYHIKVVETFAATWPRIDISNYSSASTPLSYLIMTAVGKSFGFEIWKLRLLSVIATFLATNVFHGICKRIGLPNPLLSSFTFLFFPYVFFFGFTIYPTAIALFFGLAALSVYLRDNATSFDLLKGSALAGLAVLSRQSFLIIPAGMALHELWEWYRSSFKARWRRLIERLLILAIPIMVFVPFLVIWGGFTSPINRADEGGTWFLILNPQQLNYILMVLGFYFVPMLLRQESRVLLSFRRTTLPIWAVLLILFYMFPITFDENSGSTQYVGGLIAHGLYVLEHSLGKFAGLSATLGLWAIGAAVLFQGWTIGSADAIRDKLSAIMIMFVLLMLLSPVVYERYYVLLIPMITLVLHRYFRSTKLLTLWVVWQASVAAVVSYWQIAVK